MDSVRYDSEPEVDVEQLRGDRKTQHDVLEALAECENHRRWFEIGSGFGDYAKEWIPAAEKFTATEADPALLPGLRAEMAAYPNVTVRQVLLPTEDRADHSCLVSYNVLEHIDDHIGALRSMARLVRPEDMGPVISLMAPMGRPPSRR